MNVKQKIAIVSVILIAIPTALLEARGRISRSGGGSRSSSSRSVSSSRSSAPSRSISSSRSMSSRSGISSSRSSSRPSTSSRSGISSSRSSSRPSISSRSGISSSRSSSRPSTRPSISSRPTRSYSTSRSSSSSRPRLSTPSTSRSSRLSTSRSSSVSRPAATASRAVRSGPLSSRSLSSRSYHSTGRSLHNYNGPHVIRNPRGMFRSPTTRIHRNTTRVVGRPSVHYNYRGDRYRFHTHVSFGYPWYRYRYGYYHNYRPVVRIYGHTYYPTYYYDPYYYDYYYSPQVVRVVTPSPQVIVNQVGVTSSPTVTYTEAPVRQTAQEKLIDDLLRGSNEERKLAAMQLGQYKNISATAALLDALINDGSDEVRTAAAQSLGAISDPAAYEALLRAAAVEPLGPAKQEMEVAAERIRTTVGQDNLYVSPKMPPMNQGDEKLGQYLEELRYGDAKTREEAADALEKYPGTQTTAALINILINDYNAEVREEAAESFQKIRDRMALPFLKWAQLNDTDKDVRKDSEKAVENIYHTIP